MKYSFRFMPDARLSGVYLHCGTFRLVYSKMIQIDESGGCCRQIHGRRYERKFGADGKRQKKLLTFTLRITNIAYNLFYLIFVSRKSKFS